MAACPDLRAQNRKRKYADADPSQDIFFVRPSKKPKLKDNHSASRFPPPEFWDSLSKVWLTPRALRELDRRNQLQGHTRTQTRAQAPTYRFTSGDLQLQRFARHGGPELSDLQGHPEPKNISRICKMSSRRSSRSDRSSRSFHSGHSKSTNPPNTYTFRTSNTSGRRSSAYDADFKQHLIDNAINLNNRKSKPDNVEQMRRRLAQTRPSLSPSRFSNTAFEEFQQKNEDVINEGDVMRDVLPVIYGNADIPHKENLLFTRLESITNKSTVDAKPDFYDGALTDSLDEQVRKELGRYVVPTVHRTAPIAPNFFLEAKAPKGGADVAKRQITYNLSLGARGMRELQSYAAGEPVYDNNAYTLSATYHAGTGTLQMYASHITPTGPGGLLEYHTTQIGAHALTGDPDSYQRGATALRNGRDMMKEYRDEFISTANERARSINAARSTLDSSNYSGLLYTTNTYLGAADELAATSFYADEEPELSEDELAGESSHRVASSFPCPATASFSYRLEESKTSDDFAASFSHPATTSFLYPAKSGDDGLLNVSEESEISTDELAKPTSKPVPSKRPLKGLERKHVFKASRTLHEAVPSASQLNTSSGYQALPSTYQLRSTISRYPRATTIQYKRSLPSTIPNSNRAGEEGKQDDNDYEYEDEEEQADEDEDYLIGGNTEIPQAVSSSAHYLVVRLTKKSHTLGRDEFVFKDLKGKTRYTKQKDWQKITFQRQPAWIYHHYISYDLPK